MLTVLDSYKDETTLFDVIPPLDGVEFVIQFNSGTFPRGVFCCLIVQLVQKVDNWKFQVSLEGKRCVYADFVMFCTNSGQYVLLHDKITHLEIQVRKNVKTGSIHCEVQQTIVNMLQQMQQSTGTDFKCAFYCKSKPCLIYLSSHHVTGQIPLPNGLICENHGFVELLSCSHKLWCDITKASLAMPPQSRFSALTFTLLGRYEMYILTRKLEERVEEKVFTDNYATLTKVLNVNALIPHFIAMRVITFDDASDIKSCSQDLEKKKIMKLLEYIARHLKAGHTNSFYQLLDVMKTRCTISAEMLANEMESSVVKLSKGFDGDIASQFHKSISLPTEVSPGMGHAQSYSHSISEPTGNVFSYQPEKSSTD
ncbi:uncharacterized protein [Dysidea avara]|uniref:uncharacterized protein n=1 Tax=Dysidea avara TaxID=196820 RepID=UPI0033228280